MRLPILAVFLCFFAIAAGAKDFPPGAAKARRAEADILYQKGMNRYAAGLYPEALIAFQEAQRRDPQSRAARAAVNRVRAEMEMMASAEAAAARANAAPEETILDKVLRVVEFEDTLGDEHNRQGRVKALMGRIAQLLAEKKIARAHHRRFGKDRELHALSRRLT